MKLIRWLLSNIILIAFILALTYAYVYWDNLTGPDTPAGKVIAVLMDEFESVREFVESYQPDTEPAEQSAVALSGTAVTEQQAEAPPVDQSPAAPVRQSPPPPVRQPVPPVTQPEPVAPVRPASSVDAAATERELWIAARTAFHNGQFEKSIDLYRDVIAANRDSFDAWGEMGNVYLRTGDPVQAGAAYYEAAAIMVRLGQSARARSVLPLLHRLDRNKAMQLNELLLRPAGHG